MSSTFDPGKHSQACERILSRALRTSAEIICAEKLKKSTRESPWRLDVMAAGEERSFVLQTGDDLDYEFNVLRLLEQYSLSTPRAFVLEEHGAEMGFPFSIREYIPGDSLLEPMLAGEPWAEVVYFEAIEKMQALTEVLRENAPGSIKTVTIDSILEETGESFSRDAQPLAAEMVQVLLSARPRTPPEQFSNGDLWLDNFLIRDHRLAGVIDFQHAAFSDPVYEFLLSFFVEPRLKGRGVEERYCRKLKADPQILDWYRGLELFETWEWVRRSGRPFCHHTRASLEADMVSWLVKFQ